jgi:hypothetical protein
MGSGEICKWPGWPLQAVGGCGWWAWPDMAHGSRAKAVPLYTVRQGFPQSLSAQEAPGGTRARAPLSLWRLWEAL